MTSIDHVYLLGGQPKNRLRFRRPIANLRSKRDIHQAMVEAATHSSVWIATRADSTDELLLKAMSAAPARGPKHRLGRLLLLFPPRLDSLPALEELFDPVAWGGINFRLLHYQELVEVLAADNRHDLFVAGFVDPRTEILVLYRGDFERLAVPLALFKKLGSGPKPDPSALALADFGQTVCLGKYEAASEAILYEADPEYRRRVNAKRREDEKSFGASLRRLRILKGLRQSDFPSILAKTIGRIERGEVAKPQRETLEKIARPLGVEPADIQGY